MQYLRIVRILSTVGVTMLALVACDENHGSNDTQAGESATSAASGENLVAGRGMRAGGHRKGTYAQRAAERFSELDTDKDGKATRAEVEAVHRARFEQVDSNGDGVLDKAEMTAFHDAKRTEHAEARFAAFDDDGDGKLSMSEVPRFISERFDAVDADGDGSITFEEMAAANAHRPARPKGGQGPHLLAMNLDGDGRITLSDFEMKQAGWFAQVDANSDGVLTLEEVRVGRSGQGGGGRSW